MQAKNQVLQIFFVLIFPIIRAKITLSSRGSKITSILFITISRLFCIVVGEWEQYYNNTQQH